MGFLLCTFCFRSPNRLNRCDWEPHRRVVVWIKMNQYEFGYLTWPHNRCFYCEYKYNTQESIVIQAIVVESNLLVYLSSVLKVGREYFPTTTTRCQQKFTFEPCQLSELCIKLILLWGSLLLCIQFLLISLVASSNMFIFLFFCIGRISSVIHIFHHFFENA